MYPVSWRIRRAAPGVVLVLGMMTALPGAAGQDTFVEWCQTQRVWEAKGIAGYPSGRGGCDLMGDCDLPRFRDAHLVTESTLFKTIRVHIHVLREDDGSNPAAEPWQVEAVVEEINADYAPWRVRFDCTWGYIDDSDYRDGNNNIAMKAEYAISPETTCNVFINGLGYSYGTFPWDPAATTAQGGIVFSEGHLDNYAHVLTHEMGHNVGLWHTHHGVSEVEQCGPCYEIPFPPSDTTGDFCADTPPTPVNYQCYPPGGNDPCSSWPWGPTQVENYMGYSGLSGCWSMFTPKQGGRIHCWIEAVLTGWLTCTSEEDCNGNFVPDDCDIAEGTSLDDNGNGIPDECEFVGDMNCDGTVDSYDIDGFVCALSPQCDYEGLYPDCDRSRADCNGDGDVNSYDIDAFVAIVGGG